MCVSTPCTILVLYDPQADTKISADASSRGHGAVLLQKNQQEWRSVAYASQAMLETETRYAQIEKEALAITWACENSLPIFWESTSVLRLTTNH